MNQNIGQKILSFIKNVFLVFWGFFHSLLFLDVSERKQISKGETKKQPLKNRKISLQEEGDASEAPKSLFQDFLKQEKKFFITDKQLEKEMDFIVKKMGNISCQESFFIWKKNTFLKLKKAVQEEKIMNLEELKKQIKEEVKSFSTLKKKTDFVLQNVAQVPKNTQKNQPFFEKEMVLSNIENVVEDTPTKKQSIKISPIVMSTLKEKKEENIPSFEKNISVLRKTESIFENQEILKDSFVMLEKEEVKIDLSPEQKFEDKKSFDSLKQEPKFIEKEETKELKQYQIEKNKESLNFKAIFIEDEKIQELVFKEIEKEKFIEHDYEIIEQMVELRIAELESFLLKSLTKESQETLQKEINKMKKLKHQIYFYQLDDLEKERKSLESTISKEELDFIHFELKRISDQTEEELNLLMEVEKQSLKQARELEKKLLKEKFAKGLKEFTVPFFIGYPFFRNSYFFSFVSGFFLTYQFLNIKRLFTREKKKYQKVDLSYLQKGQDAFIKNLAIAKENICYFENLKQMTFEKYPELKQDEEFLNTLNDLQMKLYYDYRKLQKKQKFVSKYFSKSKILNRKLEKKG